MIYLLLALMMIIVNGISIISEDVTSATPSALTQRDQPVTIKRADIWNLFSA
ncbi:hypothetical protein NVP1118B_29 [Vibrio phage 1.118.B._10N.261.49.F6]|nr:hypothetical protein NVP1118A_29 [Vibrio phage 1.118.A._10N.261.49.F6]AUR88885.1 hypothetical protein NVP1118B_29 [Vibrio phage 1.118.B._10N.261.49.F6]